VLSIGVEIAVRCLLVLLFLPFSALDKLLNFRQAVGQAQATVASVAVARIFIAIGFAVEVFMSAAILVGFADRAAAVVLAGYCIVTALLWKQFWRTADFKLRGASRGRDTFWDFLKNLALAGGFLTLAFGADAGGVDAFLHAPLASSHPYRLVAPSENRRSSGEDTQ
jgi:putative oxidoreductase